MTFDRAVFDFQLAGVGADLPDYPAGVEGTGVRGWVGRGMLRFRRAGRLGFDESEADVERPLLR
ncbi:MAG: hypothetical protein M5U09_03350 [Gammaproteobacteria bacterium]|nr:hypothetical protein [Gammaproteobacteria bacterium]